MPKITALCFIFSLSFGGIGNLELLNLTGYANANANDSNLQVLLPVSRFVLIIFSL